MSQAGSEVAAAAADGLERSGAEDVTDLTGVWGPATAVPPHPVSPDLTRRFLTRYGRLTPRRAEWLGALLTASGVETRHTCVPEYEDVLRRDEATDSVTTNWETVLGGLRGRMGRYRHWASNLGEAAARQVLGEAGVVASGVTHLVWVTCTGFENPGPDVVVADRLGLAEEVHRVQVGFMGCQASVQGLRLADAICRSEPQAIVLLVCVELCTLHFDPTRADAEHLVVCSLFSDGASAALLSRRSLASEPLLRLGRFASRRIPSGADLLTWEVGEPTFRMGLGKRLPAVVAKHVGAFVAPLLPPGARTVREVAWAVHPGGRAVLDAVASSLDLAPDQLGASRRVLADFGNMSSPTLLFVLGRACRRPGPGVALAFGPGLSLEGFAWHAGPGLARSGP